MKKQVLSLLLVMLMVVSLVPMSALAATNGHTANEAIGWVQSQVGKALDYDGVYGAQCVDLIKTIFYKGIMPSETGFRFSSGL